MKVSGRGLGSGFLVVVLAVVVISTASCTTTASNEYGATGSTSTGREWIQVHDKSLGRQLTFKKNIVTGRDDLLQAAVVVSNTTPKTLDCEYKFSWFDRNGVHIESAVEAWTPVMIYGMGTKQLTSVAPSPVAVSMVFYIRKANPVY